MPPLHSILTREDLASALGLSSELLQAETILHASPRWVALVPIGLFFNDPLRVHAPVPTVDPEGATTWMQRILGKGSKAAPRITKPATEWNVAAEIEPGLWMWLGDASCHSWSLGKNEEITTVSLLLEHRVPRDLFLRIRAGEKWIPLGGGLDLDGDPQTPATRRLQSIAAQTAADVFVSRWEGEQFCLQFNGPRSVFYVMQPEDTDDSVGMRYARCAGATAAPDTNERRLEMHCSCCGIGLGHLPAEAHMTREFGLFVLEWLIEHDSLPPEFPSHKETRDPVEWIPFDPSDG